MLVDEDGGTDHLAAHAVANRFPFIAHTDERNSRLLFSCFEVEVVRQFKGGCPFVLKRMEVTFKGFTLKGSLAFSFLKSCDRCLEKFEDVHNPAFKLWLTSNMDLIKDENIDVIPFPNTMSEKKKKNVFHDFIFLEDPLKYLCSNDCKGLCHHCGLNLNNNSCNCVTISTDTPFDMLENMVR